MCEHECGPLERHRNNYVNKQKKIKEQSVAKTLERFIDNKPYGGVGEVANATGCGPVIHGFNSHTSPQLKRND
jgi:hypothetical protein